MKSRRCLLTTVEVVVILVCRLDVMPAISRSQIAAT